MLISVKYGNFKIIFLIFFLLALFSSIAMAQTYKDSFSGGKAQLRWNFFPHFFLDNLKAIKDQNAPDGDGGIGVLINSNRGGFAALSYAITEEVADFYLEAFVYCHTTDKEKGQLNGVAFLIDPINSRFYRFICDFNGKEPTLNVAYVGKDTSHFPVYLKFWNDKEVPGGIPKKPSWNKMAVKVKNGKATFYWNEKALSGVVDVSRVGKGFVGVYANYVGGLGTAETKVDSFILRIE